MKLNQLPAPHIRYQENCRTLMGDIILLLCVLVTLAYLFYGMRALAVCGVAVIVSVLLDALCVCMRGRRPNPRDLSPIVTGLLIALAMPATVSYTVVITSVFFAIVCVKHPFGGTGHNLFNPAAAGFSLAALCWPQQIFSYPNPFDIIPVFGSYSAKAGGFVFQDTVLNLVQNPAYVLKTGGLPNSDPFEMLLGNFPGPMGATNILVIVACLFFLIFRNTIHWQLPASFLGTCALVAYLLPRTDLDRAGSLQYELMSGILLFGAVFMLSDPSTTPHRSISQVIYGVFAGIITMLFRYYDGGGLEESFSFAILFANAFVPCIDRQVEKLHRLIRRKRIEAKLHKTAAPAEPLG